MSRDHPAEVGKVSYASHVAAIMQNKCQTCHRPGQTAPFSLLSYDDARKHSAMIREVVAERRMPPWHADPRYGHFVNDRSLIAKERATLLAWVDQGTPLGDIKDLPPARKFPEGWTIGKPDVVFEIAGAVLRAGAGSRGLRLLPRADQLQGGRLDSGRRGRARRPVGGPSHHRVTYSILQGRRRPSGARRALLRLRSGRNALDLPRGNRQANSRRRRIYCSRFTTLPQVACRRIAPKSGLVFAKSQPTREAFTLGVANPNLLIPARQDNVAVSSSFVLPEDARLLSFLPHMHLRGKDFKYTITKPGEPPQIALSVPAYDFGWQTYYTPRPADEPAQGDARSTASLISIIPRAIPITQTRTSWSAGVSKRSRKC